jgi:short-subunit dehydrogenase
MRTRVIFGANSAIATATARLWAGRGDRLYLLARDPQRLSRLAADLEIRGAGEVSTAAFEATDRASHGALVTKVFARMGQVDTVLVAHGSLPDQPACERDIALAGAQIDINASGTVSLLGHIANHLQAQGHGCIAVITSVAGERGRQSNYVYGAAKAMVSTFLQGLRNRLYPAGVQVLDIRPGFVDSPMTAGFDKGPLWAQPESIAAVIAKGVDRGRSVTYAPWYWRYIMWVIRCLPEALFKRLRL